MAPTQGVSQQGTPIKRPNPFLSTRNIAISVGLFLVIGFFARPLWENVFQEIIREPGQLFIQLKTGLIKGSYLAVIALGYTLVYGIIELINFAHADVYMIGAFASLTLIAFFNITPEMNGLLLTFALFGIMLLVMAFTAALNAGIELFAYRPLRKAPRLAPLISAIGVSFILQNVGQIWGEKRLWAGIAGALGNSEALLRVSERMGSSPTGSKEFPPLFPTEYKNTIVFVVSVILLVSLYSFVRFTKVGKAMRATAQDRDAARLMGINVDRTISLTFLLGGALAGAAGLLVGLFNGNMGYQSGFTVGLLSFTAAVLGGIGNIVGTAMGGFLIGLVQALSDQYLGTRWSNAPIFAILVIILVFRPTGLLGEEGGQKA